MNATPAQLAEAIRAHLQLAPGESLYGVVDGAQDLELAYEAKCLYGQEIVTLFEGGMAPALADVAPYVVPVDPNTGYLENWASRWGKNAGVLLTTSAGRDELCRHLRAIFVVQDDKGQQYFFRFYDPRVLRVFPSTCTVKEALEFFGPIRFFLCEAVSPEGLLRYSVAGSEVRSEMLALFPGVR